MNKTKEKNCLVILGNQLFDPELLRSLDIDEIFMAEDYELCTYEKHHKSKIYLFLVSMREYQKELENFGYKVNYYKLKERIKGQTYCQLLGEFLEKNKIKKVHLFEIEDRPFEIEMDNFLKNLEINHEYHSSPMFLFSRREFKEFQGEKKNFRMASFYKYGRKKLSILVDSEGNPTGEKWSFDEENRKKIPKGTEIPSLPLQKKSVFHQEINDLIIENFNDHPGNLNNLWFPTNRVQARKFLNIFLEQRLENFGIYEDAMIPEKNFLFHSSLSSSLNTGLVTPNEIVKETLKIFKKNKIPLNSVEGFLRQVIGWREFIRGIYQEKGDFQIKQNYWNHTNKLTDSWYEGTTGIIPLDDCIKTTLNDGYHHHIPRLMIISNLMNMCEIDPNEIYKWFMEMYIDSSDWVMVPNVYGMATYADGGLMSTKPYTCGSNYILKMSNYSKGDWCDTVDGLYWRFTEKHRSFYESNARINFLTRTLDRLDPDRKKRIFQKADQFIKSNTK